VTFELGDGAFSVYDMNAHGWIVEAGEYEIRIGASSRDIRLSQRLVVNSQQQISAAQQAASGPEIASGELLVSDAAFADMLGKPIPPPESVRPYHLNSSISEIAETWLGNVVRKKVVAIYQSRLGANVTDETLKKMFAEMANNMPMRALATLGGGRLSFKSLHILLALLNRRYLKALGLLLRSEQAA
jgi:beta-glucosidase